MTSLTQDEHGNRLWTVLILRPDYERADDRDTFLAHVTGDTPADAQRAARAEAAAADQNDRPDDYVTLLVVPGHFYDQRVDD